MNREPNSLCLWYPLVEKVVPTPKTFWVDWNSDWSYALIDGDELPPECGKSLDVLMEWGHNQGWPCFWRTDQCAGKQGWENTCFLSDADAINRNLLELLERNETADIMGLPYMALVIREFLRAESPFRCLGYGNFPITLERRIFVRDGDVICDHPYWPASAIEAGRPSIPNWREKFAALEKTYDENQGAIVHELAEKVSCAVPGYWSVDFLLADGSAGHGWYLTDMALGEQSYHVPECPNAKR